MKHWKRTLSLLLCLALVCALLPQVALLASAATYNGTCGANGDNLTWTLNTSTGVLTITGTGDMTRPPWSAYSNSISSVLIGDGVTSIGDTAFYNCCGLTNVTIPDSVTSIGYQAFYNCCGLTNVTIPDGVTSIGVNAFAKCSGLTSVTIPDSVTRIGDTAFSYCSGLTSVTIGSGVTSMGEFAFLNCSNLTSVTICDGVTSIGEYAFSKCSGLTSVTIPGSVTSIGNAVFSGCTGLTSIVVDDGNPVYDSRNNCNAIIETATNALIAGCKNTVILNSVTSIGSYAFSGCTGLTNVTIPDSVTSIGYQAFCGCTGLTSVTIPDGVTSIGNSAFSGCTSLTSVTIGSGVTSIGNGVFCGCTWLRTITIPDSVTSIGGSAFSDCARLLSVTIPDSVTSIGGSAFYGCTGLTSVTIGDGVTSIGSSAFAKCSGLTSVTIGNSVTELENYAFHYCSGLTSVTLPDGVTDIGGYAFCYCSGLTSIAIPDSVTSISSGAFANCTSLTDVYYNGTESDWNEITIGSYNTSLTDATIHYAPAHTHDYTAVVTAATCTEAGYTTYTCACGDSYISDETAALGHNFIDHAAQAATCTEAGWAAYQTCSRCDYSTYEEIPALGHNYTAVVTAATCTEGGYTTYTCACGDSYVSDETAALGHDLIDHAEQAATCTEAGWNAYQTCSRCDYSSYEEIPALGHNYTAVVTAPTCTEGGYTTYTCACGDSYVSDETAALGHDYTAVVTAPTCTEAGYTTYTCVCGDSYISDETAALGHDLVDHAAQAATCTAVGWNAYQTCSRCDYSTYEEIPALGHNYEDGACTVCGASAFVSGNCGNGLTWTLDISTGVLTISGSGAMWDYNPYYSNPNIAYAPWYNYRTSVRTVSIGNSVTSIGTYAFRGCTELTSATIGDSVTSIGLRAFSGCTGLTSVTIGNSVTSIGAYAFTGCYELTNVTIPDSVTILDEDAFSSCTSLTSVVIGNGVTSIGRYAFDNCASLSSVTFGNSVASIGEWAFDNCVSLSSVTIGNSVTSIENWAFYGCSGLTSVTIPDSVTSIGDYVFIRCSGLTDVYYCGSASEWNAITIGRDNTPLTNATIHYNCCYHTWVTWAGCTTVAPTCTEGGYTVYVCSKCGASENMVIPALGHDYVDHAGQAATCTEAGWAAYQTCSRCDYSSYEEIPALGHNYEDGVCTACGADDPSCLVSGTSYDLTWTLNTVTGMLTITGTGEMLASPWYNYCTYIRSVVIDDGITRICNSAFATCCNLMSVTIPDSVTSIGDDAFRGCAGLTSVTIPDSVTAIGDFAFYGCNGLTEVHITDVAAWCGINFAENSSNPLQAANCLYLNGTLVTDLVIPDSVTSIGNQAFYRCSALTSVTIPDSVTTIGDYAFAGCSGLTSITIPDSVTSIGSGAFSYSGLTSVTIPDGVTTLSNYVFSNCSGLTSVTIPDGVTSIGDSAFYNCSGLTSVTIPDGVTSIGDSAFYNCSGLTSVTIPDGVTTIGNNVFAGCRGLTSVTIPDGVTSIGSSAFYFCDGMTGIAIPDSVTSIGSGAFSYSGLTSVTIPDSVTSIGSGAFANSDLRSITIPEGVTSIGNNAFGNCIHLGSITVDENNPAYDSRENCNALIETSTNTLLTGCGNTVIPDSVTSIGNRAFEECWGLRSITIPDSVTSIGDEAFYWCSALTSVTIPDSVTTIGDYAFFLCSRLTNVYYAGSESDWSNITIGSNNTPLDNATIHYNYCNHNLVELDREDATCTEDGEIFYRCTKCRKYFTETIAALGHDWGEWALTTAPTCTVNGEETRPCTRCDAAETRPVAATGHTAGEPTQTDRIEPTCTADGSYDTVTVCTVCGTELSRRHTILTAPGHTPGTAREENRVDAACTADGGYDTAIYCTVCGAELERTHTTVAALGHDWGEWLCSSAPGCTTEGEDIRYCSRCNATETRAVAAIGHDYASSVTEPTCTETGYTTYTCTHCADSYVADETPALGHDWGEWQRSSDPACTTEGEDIRYCSRCNASETRAVAALGHNYAASVTEPTCTQAGFTTYTCLGCADSYVADETPALGHDWGEWLRSNEPGCTTEGEDIRYCNRCNASETRTVAALGHDYAAEVTAPTCLAGGYTTYTCTRCADSYVADPTIALGHDYEVTVMREATVSKTGRMGVICTRCDFDEFVILPILSTNDYDLSNNTATCTEPGTATYTWKDTTYCVYSTEGPSTAQGHDLGYTDNGDGTHTVSCSRCDYSVTKAHDLSGGACVCGAMEPAPGIKSASLVLNEDIDVRFTVELPAGGTNPYLVVNGTTINAYTEADGALRFVYTGITPQRMGDSITAVLHAQVNGEEYIDTVAQYSVRQYCVNMLNNTDDDTLKTLLSDLLTYGAAAQAYTGYQTDSLVTDGLDLTPSEFSAVSGKTVSFEGTADAATGWIGAGLILGNTVTMRFVFFAESTADLTVSVSINGREATFDADDFVSDGGGKYHVDFTGIEANEFDDAVTAAFYRNDAQVGRAVSYTVNAYVCAMQNSEDANLQALVRALYNYGASAAAYASASEE